jgi:hypothetical protein
MNTTNNGASDDQTKLEALLKEILRGVSLPSADATPEIKYSSLEALRHLLSTFH